MKPNILFIMTDQQRYDTVDSPAVALPNMQRLKKESVHFSNFYASAMPCVPSRACFLTGRNAWDLKICGNDRFLTDDMIPNGSPVKSWMQILREQGYASVSVGKTHMIHGGSYHIPVPLDRSFGDEDGWDHFHPKASPQPEDTFYDLHVARRACDALERLSDRGPFAMFVGFHAPHEPYVLPEKYLDFCRPEDVVLPENRSLKEYREKSESYRKRVDHFRRMFGDCIDDDEAIRRGIAGYYCALKMIDDCLGQLLDCLCRLGIDRETFVVFTSDHGELLGEHYLFNKNATAYDGEIHIPFLLRYPDRSFGGKTVAGLGGGIDFLPTLMDLLGLRSDLPMPGCSLVPAIQSGKQVRAELLIWHLESSLTLLCEEAKLTYCPESGDGELYDLIQDPEEMHNLWNQDEAKGLKEKMLLRMLHRRLLEDKKASRMTSMEWRLHDEVYASKEPEVVGGNYEKRN